MAVFAPQTTLVIKLNILHPNVYFMQFTPMLKPCHLIIILLPLLGKALQPRPPLRELRRPIIFMIACQVLEPWIGCDTLHSCANITVEVRETGRGFNGIAFFRGEEVIEE